MNVLYELVLPRLGSLRRSGDGYMAKCPVHDDTTASLAVSPGVDQPVAFFCHAGCDTKDVIEAIGLTWEQILNPRGEKEDPITYDYRDENGVLLYQVVRGYNKKFLQRAPDATAKDGWSWKLGDTRRVLYHLADVIQGIKDGREVWIVEGEKDVDTLVSRGMVATCNSGGAGKWLSEFAEFFHDAVVTVVADKDDPGQVHARKICESLVGIATAVRRVEAAVGKDASDHFAAGKTSMEFVEIWSDQPSSHVDLAPDFHEFLATEDDPYDWIVPDLLERGDRLVFTGFEGLGKTMVLRQMSVCIAAGLHPFTFRKLTKKHRVLFIDCENSERQSRRRFRPLDRVSRRCDAEVPSGGFHIIHRPEGVDLTRDEYAEWLEERVTAHQPDILFIGPFYRLHNVNMNDELAARRVATILDRVRAKANCALVTEAHAGHAKDGAGMRSLRPSGSSLFLRWPEFGMGIKPTVEASLDPREPVTVVDVMPWRGGRDERVWPKTLKWGRGADCWPWLDPDFVN